LARAVNIDACKLDLCVLCQHGLEVLESEFLSFIVDPSHGDEQNEGSGLAGNSSPLLVVLLENNELQWCDKVQQWARC